jgi:drug/metabolite transporter (DMT)-like permease
MKANKLWLYAVIVVVAWGLVPALAKGADYPGGFTTFWVNVFSAVGVFLVMTVGGYLPQFKQTRYYSSFITISVIWPLLFSLSYFGIISNGSGSLATLMTYLWPLMAMFLLSRTTQVPQIGLILASGGFAIVALTMLAEGNIGLSAVALLFGLIAPFTQAYFHVATKDRLKYPGEFAWLLTFVGALVTVVGSAVYVGLFEGADFTRGASAKELLPLAIIGIGANSIGFYAFLRASQLSETSNQEVPFLLAMFFVPFAQVLFLLMGVERDIHLIRFLGIVVVAVGFFAFKRWESQQKKNRLPSP